MLFNIPVVDFIIENNKIIGVKTEKQDFYGKKLSQLLVETVAIGLTLCAINIKLKKKLELLILVLELNAIVLLLKLLMNLLMKVN